MDIGSTNWIQGIKKKKKKSWMGRELGSGRGSGSGECDQNSIVRNSQITRKDEEKEQHKNL